MTQLSSQHSLFSVSVYMLLFCIACVVLLFVHGGCWKRLLEQYYVTAVPLFFFDVLMWC